MFNKLLIACVCLSASISSATEVAVSNNYFLDVNAFQSGTASKVEGFSYSSADGVTSDDTLYRKKMCLSKPPTTREEVWWDGLYQKRKCKNINHYKTTYSWVDGSCKGIEVFLYKSTKVECKNN